MAPSKVVAHEAPTVLPCREETKSGPRSLPGSTGDQEGTSPACYNRKGSTTQLNNRHADGTHSAPSSEVNDELSLPHNPSGLCQSLPRNRPARFSCFPSRHPARTCRRIVRSSFSSTVRSYRWDAWIAIRARFRFASSRRSNANGGGSARPPWRVSSARKRPWYRRHTIS